MHKRQSLGNRRMRPYRPTGMKRKINRIVGLCKANFIERIREDAHLHRQQKAALIARADYVVCSAVLGMVFGAR